MADIGELSARITADNSDLLKKVDQSTGKISEIGKGSERAGKETNKGMGNVAKSMVTAQIAMKAAQMAVNALVNAFKSVTFEAFKQVDEQAKLARQLGITNAELAVMARAADLSGVSMGTMTQATQRLDVAIGQAIQGSTAAAEKFEQLGLSARELESAGADERLLILSEAFQGIETQAEKAAVAQDLFGRSGLEMLRLLDDAQGSMERAAAEVDKYGLALSEVDTAAIERIQDNFSTLGQIMEGTRLQIASGLAPAFEMLTNMMVDASGSTNDMADSMQDFLFDAAAMEGVADVFGSISGAVEAVKTALSPLVDSIGPTLSEIAETWKENFGSAADETDRSQVAFTALAIAGEGAALAFRIIGASINLTIETMKGLVDAMATTANIARTFWEALLHGGDWSAVGDAVSDTADSFKDFGSELASGVRDYAEGIIEDVMGITDRVKRQAEEIEISYREGHERTRDSFMDAHSQMLENYRSYQSSRERIARDTSQSIAATQKYEMDSTIKGLLSLTSSFDKESRIQFEISKAAKMAMVAMDGIAAVQGAYAAGNSLGGPLLGASFAAAAGAASAVNFANVAKTQFGSASAPSAASTPAPSTDTGSGAGGGQLFVNIRGQEMFSGGAVRDLMDRIAEAQADGYKVVV